jgi:hypothetical protein
MPTTTTVRNRRTTIDLPASLADTQPRDMLLLRLLEAHQVLSTSQICTLLFPSLRVCQKRLARLRALGLVASFRRRDHAGRRQPAYWVLGPTGMRRQAIANGEPAPTNRTMRARRDRIVASPTLNHRLGANQFFVDLIAYARNRPGVELVRWWPEERATTVLRPVVPDGHGAWQVGDTVWPWFVEFDTGSMDLPRLVERMAAYDQAARAKKRFWPVLWWLHSPVREHNLHRELAGRSGLCPIATAARTPDGPGPGGRVWRLAGTGEQRWELHQLGEPTDKISGHWSDDYTDPDPDATQRLAG